MTTGVSETFVPQMLNLQLIDALSFTKGCYPGQEIVARMQYLGKLKRHMRLFKLSLADNNLVVAPLATTEPGRQASRAIICRQAMSARIAIQPAVWIFPSPVSIMRRLPGLV